MITAPQLRAARALLGIDQRKLAELSGLSVPTIQRMEASEAMIRGNVDSLMKLIGALEAAGIELIAEGAASQAGGRRQAAPTSAAARQRQHQRGAWAPAHGQAPPPRRRLSDACPAAAGAWAHPWRGGLQADGRRAGAPPRVVVPSLDAPTPARRSEALSCARGHGDNESKAVHRALRRARTAAPPCRAQALRLRRACAADVLHHALRTSTVHQPARAQAQPSTSSLPLGTIAAQVRQDTERLRRHLPSACPVHARRHRVTSWLDAVPLPVGHPSCSGAWRVPSALRVRAGL